MRKILSGNIQSFGDIFNIGEANVQILGPNSDSYINKNNYSIVAMVTFGKVRMLFTGDAEKLAEKEIMDTGYNIEADIFKAGHHGSDTSNSEKFLKKVKPKYVIISCKSGNTYGHPQKSVMELLKSLGISIYRTDESGTIVMTTDGENISFDKQKGSYEAGI